jgi:hypothetical protein
VSPVIILNLPGLLYDRISRDLDWLYTSLDSVLEDDKFTAELVRICKEAYSGSEKPTQAKHLGIFRSDYMLHEPDESTPPKLLQVHLFLLDFLALSHSYDARWSSTLSLPRLPTSAHTPASFTGSYCNATLWSGIYSIRSLSYDVDLLLIVKRESFNFIP